MEQQSLKQLQSRVDAYISQFEEGYFPPFEMLARLTEEVGELSREVQHVYGYAKKKQADNNNMEKELGDILFTLICFANAHQIQLEDALLQVLNKFETRDKDRWTRKEEKND
ncbi:MULTISPECIES: nucleotide pyrophosphohydrolase [unclassified Lysinibacillus]|uniref:nucleotide pyrophosphohydrolase n=1 Tax=unclassified Lysinibacillus TaxID=2636778 RepID=UPI0036DFAD60